jgi:ATP-dependent DNA ligase
VPTFALHSSSNTRNLRYTASSFRRKGDFGTRRAIGFEGIVAKRSDKPYRSSRSPDWVKVKNPDAPAATRIVE